MTTGTRKDQPDSRDVTDAKKLVLSFVLALCVHVSCFLGMWIFLPTIQKQPSQDQPQSHRRDVPPQKISHRRLSQGDWAKNRGQGVQKKQAKPKASKVVKEAERQKRKEVLPKGKVVAVETGNGQKPSDTKFLAESNNVVEKETVSRHRRHNYDKVAATPSAPAVFPPPAMALGTTSSTVGMKDDVLGSQAKAQSNDAPVVAVQPPEATSVEATRSSGEKSHQPSPQKKLSFEGLNGVPLRFLVSEGEGKLHEIKAAPTIFPKLSFHSSPSISTPSAGGDSGKIGRGTGEKEGSQLVTLTPSATALAGFLGGPASDLSEADGIPEGEGTYLNTREWKHAGFFNRIKDNVGRHWNPNAQIALKDPTGEAYLYKDRKTLVAVTLDKKGNVKSVRVTQPSGVEFLDAEALEAFRRVGSFPHPPTALQNDRGEITFGFGFYVETSRGRLQLFR